MQEFKVWFWNRFWVKWNGLKYDSNAIIFVLYKGCVSYSWFFSEWEPKSKMIPLCATCTYTTPSTPLEIVQTLYISIMKVIVWWFDRKHDSYYLSDLSSRDLKIKMIKLFLEFSNTFRIRNNSRKILDILLVCQKNSHFFATKSQTRAGQNCP